MLVDQGRQEIAIAGIFEALKPKLLDHLALQGQQFGEHVLRMEFRIRIGGAAGGPHEGKNVVHWLEKIVCFFEEEAGVFRMETRGRPERAA